MISLILAIMSSASIALIFKISENGKYNRYRVTTANYFTAFTFSLFLYISSSSHIGIYNAITSTDWYSLMLIGIPAGCCFFLSFVLYQQSVKDNGASLSAMVGKLGILIPMLASIILWKEIPTITQMIGIILAISAILYVNFKPSATVNKSKSNGIISQISLILLFFAGGMAEFSNKLFQKYGQASDKGIFLFIVFFVAFLISLRLAIKKQKIQGSSWLNDLKMGMLVGIPNMLSSVFLISALNDVPAALAFPAYSAGSILVVTVLSKGLFNEAITKRAAVGIGMTVIALAIIF